MIKFKLYFCFVFVLVFTQGLVGQNLVPNGSFEEHIACPNNGGQLEYALYWTNPLIGGGSSPDYLNLCGIPAWNVPDNIYGNETARTGVAYSAIVTARNNPLNPNGNNGREYLQVELLHTLEANTDYCFKFYVSACDSMHYISNNIGIYFSNGEVRDTIVFPGKLDYIPQFENDSTNDLSSRVGWTEVSGRYKAVGGEKYIVIGNFRDTTTTVATYVGWSSNSSFNYAFYYIDDVSLALCDTILNVINHINFPKINAYPNPTDGFFLLESDEELIEKVEIANSVGQVVLTDSQFAFRKAITLNIHDQPSGIYLLSVSTAKNKYSFKLFKT